MSESHARWRADFDKQQQAADKRMRHEAIMLIAGVALLFASSIGLGIWMVRAQDRNARAVDSQAMLSCRASGFSEPQCTFMVSNNRRLADDANDASLATVSMGLAATAVAIAKQEPARVKHHLSRPVSSVTRP